MANISTAVITFEKGLDESTEPTRLPNGYASVLENWTNQPDGSLRARVGWIAQANTGQPANRFVRGLGTFRSSGQADLHFIGVEQVGAGYEFFTSPTDLAATTALVSRDAIATATGTRSKYVPMATGFGFIFYTHPNFPTAAGAGGIRRWNPTAAPSWLAAGGGGATASNTYAGSALAVYRDRLWVAVGTRLRWSGLADHLMWNEADLANPAGNANVDASEPGIIEHITPFKDGMMVGKTNSLWYLAGRNPFNSQLERLDAGNAAPGKSICVTPYGAFIAGTRECWIFDGVQPRPEKKRVASSYGLVGNYLTTAYQDGCVYIAEDARDDVLVYDFEQDSWRKESFARRLATLHTYADRLLGGPTNATDFPLIGYRDIPQGARNPDAVAGTTYRATTPRTWFGNSIGPVTVRHAYLKVRQRGTTGPGITVRLFRNGVEDHTKVLGPETTAGVHRYRIDTGPTGYEMHWEIEQTVPAGQTSNVDLEEILIEYEKENPR